MIGTGIWMTATEIAEAGLPGLPRDKRKMNELIAADRWAIRVGPDGAALHRKRAGRGGGFEWHSALFPERARLELVKRGLIAAPVQTTSRIVTLPPARSASDHAAAQWAAYDRAPQGVKDEAARRLAVLNAVEAAQGSGATKTRAIGQASAQHGVSAATINNWFALVAGVSRPDRLAFLAPDRKGGGAKAEIDADAWQRYVSDYLRASKPTHAACYFRVQAWANAAGIPIPHAKTFQRRLEAEIPPEVLLARREGMERVVEMLPPQERSVAHLHALHSVNIDGHKFDVRVKWPDGSIERPMLVGIQDIYSRKMLAWRIDKSENAAVTRLVYADLFRRWGIPKRAYLDNSRTFASLWMTNGAKTRFRFKTREDLPEGLLVAMGIEVVFVTPYHGQAKPIERFWRDCAEYIARHPACDGAYVGPHTQAKPHNYGEKAIPLAEFAAVVDEVIPQLNAKMGRRTEIASAGSFDQAFERSVAAGAPIGRATPEQLRMALLASDTVVADRKSGAVTFAGNRYWAEGMGAYAGQRLVLRFDPDDLHACVYAYDLKGQFVAELPIWEAVGFDNLAAAKATAALRARHRKAVRAAVEAENLLCADELARSMPAAATAPETHEPRVVRPVRSGRRSSTAAALAAPQNDVIDRLGAGLRLVVNE
ncbi:MAG: Mu transposase C-terminal domain-containing protein [Alphaproteobacteria bacterium]|nr:Mu transposase C-terminal domain-containing protein [Alphaproteobacteria bacterium]